MKIYFLAALLISLVGCQNLTVKSHTLSEVNFPLNEIRKSIEVIAGLPAKRSSNQREFTSHYFGRKKNVNFDEETAKERLYAVFTVLGDRRPYDIRITVYIERKKRKNEFTQVGTDLYFAKRLGNDLNEKLNLSRGGRSVIDEFKPF